MSMTDEQLALVAIRLCAIRRAILRERYAKALDQLPSDTFELLDMNELCAEPFRDRINWDGREGGLNYAAWCIGETLANCGGLDLMHRAFNVAEDYLCAIDGMSISWLDHAWNGVVAPDDSIWVS